MALPGGELPKILNHSWLRSLRIISFSQKTERLMISNRPKNPANARNKNVLIVRGSGSGKTRFWLMPNLLQCHSSYVCTDPTGQIVRECGNALLKHGYAIKIFNTINFIKTKQFNPFA